MVSSSLTFRNNENESSLSALRNDLAEKWESGWYTRLAWDSKHIRGEGGSTLKAGSHERRKRKRKRKRKHKQIDVWTTKTQTQAQAPTQEIFRATQTQTQAQAQAQANRRVNYQDANASTSADARNFSFPCACVCISYVWTGSTQTQTQAQGEKYSFESVRKYPVVFDKSGCDFQKLIEKTNGLGWRSFRSWSSKR